ncbi:MAG: exosortase/archaeosortase family protein [Isosphaeraceae bacterium]
MAEAISVADDTAARPAAGWAGWACLAAVVAALVAAYFQEFSDLVATWSDNPDYSHGYLVIPVALAILYFRWPGAAKGLGTPSILGWGLAILAVAARTYWHESGRPWLEQVTLLPLIFGLALALGGWRLMRWAWPGLAYLAFMFPLPPAINQSVSMPLQRLATTCSSQLVRLTGLWVTTEGNVIYVGAQPLEVARACNGLSMLMTMAAIVAVLVLLVPMPVWKRLILMATFVPVALLCNVLRISATAWSYHLFGAEVGEKYAHDFAGLMMVPVALALVGLEMVLLSWLVSEQEVVVLDKPLTGLILPGVPAGGPAAAKPNP